MKIKLIIPFLFLVVFTGCIKSKKADLIVRNALIYSVDGTFSTAQAMAIKDGKILELGKEHDILNAYRYNEVFDAQTRPIYPGFIDAHCHFLNYGIGLQQVDLTETKSFNEVIERIKIFSESHPDGWITGRGWDQNDWEVQEFPTNDTLNILFPNRPVCVRRVDGHAALANSKALETANISATTKVAGGIVELKNNQLTGILIDNAMDLILKAIPAPTNNQLKAALIDAQKNCFEVGLTTVDDAGLDKSHIELIQQLQNDSLLKMRIYAMLTDNEENLNYYPKNGPIKTERLNVCSFKFYGDGALGSRGACLIEPYTDVHNSKHHGFLLSDTSYFKEKASMLYGAGFQVNTHCIGDSANRALLDIYASILRKSNDKRWRIEHCQVVDTSDLYKFRKYGIIPSVQPTHATSDMYWAKDRLGEHRIDNAYAYKTLLNQLGFIALGTDFPIEGINPLNTFYSAVVRKDMNDFPEGGFEPENALSREQALMGMTIWAAMSNFEEQEKGSLEPGKLADFVVLEKDILKVDEKELKNNKVIATFINGEMVYAK